eukprot:COSAG02_NODE_4259_length_5577_cov_12.639102_5_plen_162_part_01
MVIDTLGTFLAPLIGESVTAEDDCDSASATSGSLSSSRSSAQDAHHHSVRGLSDEDQEFKDDEALEAVKMVKHRDQALVGAAPEQLGERLEERQGKEEDVQWEERPEMRQDLGEAKEDEDAACKLSVLRALCGRFQLDMEDTLDRITYSCTCNADGGAMNTA